jgi:hypothetical protein
VVVAWGLGLEEGGAEEGRGAGSDLKFKKLGSLTSGVRKRRRRRRRGGGQTVQGEDWR